MPPPPTIKLVRRAAAGYKAVKRRRRPSERRRTGLYCTSLTESFFFANTQANYILLVHALNCKCKSLYMLCFYQKLSSLT
jgi:hypothetical protein